MQSKILATKYNPTRQLRGYQSIYVVILLFLCSFITLPAYAETNAKGVVIDFLPDDFTAENANEQNLIEEGLIEQQESIEAIAQHDRPTHLNSDALALELSTTPTLSGMDKESDLWLRIKQQYAMPNIVSPHTAKYENMYASKPEYVDQMMARSQKYLFYVVEEVEKRGMPMEIALLPMIESAYNPKALSRSKAVGIWQFMPATGKHFGLKQNWWADHRRDVTASTKAALDYLETLHGMFDSWDLALAAYNAGQGTVGRAIAKNRKAGLGTDYQSLSLPLETRHYVPKLQAIKNIVNNPAQYGLNIQPIPNEPYFAQVKAPSQIDAKLVAELAEIPYKEVLALNPRFNRPVIASKDHSHQLLLPIAAIERFNQNLTQYDQPLLSWETYHAKRGEKVANIAKKFKINTTKLRKINGLPKNKSLNSPLKLLVPSSKAKTSKINIAQLERQKVSTKRKSKRVTHRIKRGETLSALAKRYGTSTKTLMKMNRLKTTKLKIGQILTVKGKRIKSRKRTKRI